MTQDFEMEIILGGIGRVGEIENPRYLNLECIPLRVRKIMATVFWDAEGIFRIN